MKTKIAISGMPRSNRTLVANALSLLTNIPFIQGRTIYEWYKLYNVPSKEDISWKDAFLIASSSFIDRIELEGQAVDFVSDGAVFTELMFLKLTQKFPRSKGRSERDKIMASLENVCLGYAARSYDCVIHIDAPPQHRIVNEREIFKKMFDSRNIPCQIYGSESPAETLSRMITLLNLPAVTTVENALYMAEKNLYISK